MSVTINRNKKNEVKYMMDVSHPDNPMAAESRDTIESEAAVLASTTAAIQGRKRPAEIRHGLPCVVDKVQKMEPQHHSPLTHLQMLKEEVK
eukprot:10450826-Ditylum_brightwellii.AAC.1